MIDLRDVNINSAETQKYFNNTVNGEHKWDGYHQAVNHAEDMGVHIWGNTPKKILEKVRPREEEDVKKYRLDSYEPITQSKAEKALSILHKIFNPKLFGLEFKEDEKSQDLGRYLLEEYPFFGDFLIYVRDVIFKNMIADPNAAICVVPSRPVTSDTDEIQPIVTIYNSWQVLDYDLGQWYLFLDKKKLPPLPNQNRERNIIHIFRLNDVITLHEFHQADGTSVFREDSRWTHELGEVPVWFLGGVTDGRFEGFFQKSFFAACVPFWNKAISAESDIDGAFINHMHPIRVELAEDCDFNFNGYSCFNGEITDKDGNKSACPSCGGTGRKSVKSPYGVYQVQKDKLDETVGLQPVQYVTVPTDPTELLEKRRDKLIEDGLAAINMEIVNKIGENQSGIAKEIDRSELHSFMLKVSMHVFSTHIYNIIYFTGRLMNFQSTPEDFLKTIMPQIIPSTQFDTMTISELTDQISRAKEGKLSAAYVQALQIETNNKQFSANSKLLNKLNAMTKLNPLPEKSVEDIAEMVATGRTSRENATIALNIEFLVTRAAEEEKDFFDKSFIEQYEILVSLSKSSGLMKEVNATPGG